MLSLNTEYPSNLLNMLNKDTVRVVVTFVLTDKFPEVAKKAKMCRMVQSKLEISGLCHKLFILFLLHLASCNPTVDVLHSVPSVLDLAGPTHWLSPGVPPGSG